MIVEPGFAERHDLGVLGALDQLGGRDVEFLVGMVRMGADGAEHLREFLGNGQHLGVFLHPRRNGHDAADAGRPRPRDDSLDLAGKIGKIEMAVAVDEHAHAAASGST